MNHHQTQLDDPIRAGQWLLDEYDVTDPDELADSIGAVQIRPICTFKCLLDGGVPMRVTALDYEDPGRWWL